MKITVIIIPIVYFTAHVALPFLYSSQQVYKVGLVIHILEKGQLRHKAIREFALGDKNKMRGEYQIIINRSKLE